MPFGVKVKDVFGLKRSLEYIDDAARAAKKAPKLIEQASRTVVEEAGDALSYSMSGEKLLNDPFKYAKLTQHLPGGQLPTAAYNISQLLGRPEKKAQLGTKGRKAIESSPILGKELGMTADALLSPISLATLGAGGSLGAGGNIGAKTGRALISPAASGPFKNRLAGEAGASLGANLGISGIDKLPLPDEVKVPLSIAAGVAGGVGGVNVANKAMGSGRIIMSAPTAKPQSRRGYINEEMSPDEIMAALPTMFGKKDLKDIKILMQRAEENPEFKARLDSMHDMLKGLYKKRFNAEPIRGVSRSTRKYGQKSVPSPDEDLAYNLERSLEQQGIEPPGPALGVVPQSQPSPLARGYEKLTPEQQQLWDEARAAGSGQVPPTGRVGEGFRGSFDDDGFTAETYHVGRGAEVDVPWEQKPEGIKATVKEFVKQDAVPTVNNLLRQAGATADASALGIQNLLGYGSINPKRQAQVLWSGFKSIFSPDEAADRLRQWDDEVVNARNAGGLSKKGLTQAEWSESGLVDMTNKLESIPGTYGASSLLEKVPVVGSVVKGSNRMFNTMVTLQSRAMADTLYEMAENGIKPMLPARTRVGKALTIGPTTGGGRENIEAIVNATNRTVGYTNTQMPKILQEGFFAPRFLVANMELLANVIKVGDNVEAQVARRQLAKLVSVGASMVYLANATRGYETDLDPTSNNFMRIRNVGGTDVSPFGYLDTLFRGMVMAAQDPVINPLVSTLKGEPEAPKFNAGKATYLLRSKASPLLSLGIDLVQGETFTGDNPRSFSSIAQYALPFSTRDASNEPIAATAFGAIGAKASPLSPGEKLDAILEKNNILESDSEYDIKRRQFLADNPQHIPEKKGEFKEAQEITEKIGGRRKALEEDVLNNTLKLVDYGEDRKDLLIEQKARLDQLNPDFKKKNTPQAKWVDSYYKLFNLATIERTGKLDNKKFDSLLGAWISENGEDAYDYVLRYSLAGKGEVEIQRAKDFRELDNLGYFDMNRYRGLKSDLSEDELEDLRNKVSAERSADPALKKLDFNLAAARVLRGMPKEVILDVINIGKKTYQNPEFTKFKTEHNDLLQWFNPNATWSTYQKAKEIQSKVRGR